MPRLIPVCSCAFSLRLLHTRPRVPASTRPSLRPLICWGLNRKHSSGASRREIEIPCPSTSLRAQRSNPSAPRKRKNGLLRRFAPRNDGLPTIPVVPANAGTHNHGEQYFARWSFHRVSTTTAAAYGSLRSQGRRVERDGP